MTRESKVQGIIKRLFETGHTGFSDEHGTVLYALLEELQLQPTAHRPILSDDDDPYPWPVKLEYTMPDGSIVCISAVSDQPGDYWIDINMPPGQSLVRQGVTPDGVYYEAKLTFDAGATTGGNPAIVEGKMRRAGECGQIIFRVRRLIGFPRSVYSSWHCGTQHSGPDPDNLLPPELRGHLSLGL